MGPIFQFIAYFLLIKLMPHYNSMIFMYHYGILLFNLLPIYPLDGGKLVNLFLALFMSYKNSLIYSILFSLFILFIMICIVLGFFDITINFIVMIFFLIYKIVFEYKRINYLQEKFLLERYLNNYNFKKGIIVNDVNSFRRDKHHLVKNNSKYYLEKEILQKKYKKY